jgi:hypothetical protein
MVNTFVTCTDFKQCAKDLDWRRLGKQRVEAMQILHILQDYVYISYKLCIKCLCGEILTSCYMKKFSCGFGIENYMKIVRDEYKKFPYFYIEDKVSKKIFKVDKKTFTKDKSKRKILSGFINHPAVKMWVCYEKCLKLYINTMIDEWINRGYKNTMKKYEVAVEVADYPKWLAEGKVIASHKLSLLKKEKERNEKEWYWKLDTFKDLWSTFTTESDIIKLKSLVQKDVYVWEKSLK